MHFKTKTAPHVVRIHETNTFSVISLPVICGNKLLKLSVTMSHIFFKFLNRIPYGESIAVQQKTRDFVIKSERDGLKGILLLLEHPPVFTGGRRVKDYGNQHDLRQIGAEYHEVYILD